MAQRDWKQEFTEQGAFWMHEGSPGLPHAELTSGGHSNGFFNGGIICEQPLLLAHVARDLVGAIEGCLADDVALADVDYVIGPAHGATRLAFAVAEQLDRRAGFTVHDSATKEVTNVRAERLERGQVVLLVEDTTTTGLTVLQAALAIQARGVTCIPVIGAMLNRSPFLEREGFQFASLVRQPMTNWTAEKCPLCPHGSEAIRPKGENWARLTAAA